MTDFIKEGIKVGDRVYSHLHDKYGTVSAVADDIHIIYVRLDGEPMELCPRMFRLNGNDAECRGGQVLFWAKPEIIVPPKPKRKIQVTKWVNVYESEATPLYTSYLLFDTPKEAKDAAPKVNCLRHIATTSITFEIDEP